MIPVVRFAGYPEHKFLSVLLATKNVEKNQKVKTVPVEFSAPTPRPGVGHAAGPIRHCDRPHASRRAASKCPPATARCSQATAAGSSRATP